MAILEVKKIKKSFGKTEVLKGVSFSMERGEVVAVLGSSGSGKTTLLRCVNFLETADTGEIFVEGNKIFDGSMKKNMTPAQIRKVQLYFGMVFQSFNLFPQYNALDNVTLAPKLVAKSLPNFKTDKKRIYDEIEANARELLDRVGLSQKLASYPCELSGGQQQRVSIARALAQNPKVLFFDEPTSALDPELTGEILKVIRSLCEKQMTMMIVTHEIEFARNVADRIIFMDGGVVVEEGTPEQVIDNPNNPRTRAFLNKLSER